MMQNEVEQLRDEYTEFLKHGVELTYFRSDIIRYINSELNANDMSFGLEPIDNAVWAIQDWEKNVIAELKVFYSMERDKYIAAVFKGNAESKELARVLFIVMSVLYWWEYG